MTVLITLTLAGSDTGPFNLYSDANGFSSPFQTGVAKSVLEAGLSTSSVPTGTTEILVRSTGVCQRDLYLPVAGAPTTTTTTSSTSSTSTIINFYQEDNGASWQSNCGCGFECLTIVSITVFPS